MNHSPIEWLGDRVRIIDQTLIPGEVAYREIDDYHELALAIKELMVRGAPIIGIAGAYAVVLGALKIEPTNTDVFLRELDAIIREIAGTRPTARNLFFTLERMKQVIDSANDIETIKQALTGEALNIHKEEAEATIRISDYGAELIEDSMTVLTHCNTGPLATSGYGTALGIIIKAKEQGKNIRVLAGETRPLLQGARLTAWELQKAGVPTTLITDSMAGHFMRTGSVDCVVTGADRIAANGDTANKTGTYTLAVLAKENDIPFYIAAPTSTIDISMETGDEIPIEERAAEEVTHIKGIAIAPEGVPAANPAFDVTPHRYISAIITEKGIIREPYPQTISAILSP
ncbi:MAG: S-methyl-5-thioribose-1-phosphate isomerase [Dehalococcoidia bacterium]|jgi:methylthioribose-1-phosphate isomerase